jgi:hypothetical protein
MRRNRHTCPEEIDRARLEIALQSPDETVRAKAIGSLCPCRVGAEMFEGYIDIVARYRKDPSAVVRASVLHVLEEAYEAENAGYPTNPREVTNEMLRRRRASRFLPDDVEGVGERKIKRGRARPAAKA